MSVTIGTYNTLPNPVESTEFHIAPGEDWTMDNGDERWHTLQVRRGWRYTWLAKGTDLSNLRAAIGAAMVAAATFKPWDTTTTYNARVVAQSVSYKPEAVMATGFWRVEAEIHQVSQ